MPMDENVILSGIDRLSNVPYEIETWLVASGYTKLQATIHRWVWGWSYIVGYWWADHMHFIQVVNQTEVLDALDKLSYFAYALIKVEIPIFEDQLPNILRSLDDTLAYQAAHPTVGPLPPPRLLSEIILSSARETLFASFGLETHIEEAGIPATQAAQWIYHVREILNNLYGLEVGFMLAFNATQPRDTLLHIRRFTVHFQEDMLPKIQHHAFELERLLDEVNLHREIDVDGNVIWKSDLPE